MLKDKLTASAAMLLAAALGFGLLAAAEGSVKSVYTAPAGPPLIKASAPEPPEPEPAFLPALSSDESVRMSNCANYQLFTEDPSTGDLIGRAYADGVPSLVRIKDPESGEFEILAEGCWLGNIQYDPATETVYGLDVLRNGALVAVTGGEVFELPAEAHTYCLFRGNIYFIDHDTMFLKLCRFERTENGDGVVTADDVLDIRMDCPFVIGDEVVCVSLDEGNSIWAYKLDGSGGVCLAEESASCPVIDGNELFYLSDAKSCICVKDLETGETEVYERLHTLYTFFILSRLTYNKSLCCLLCTHTSFALTSTG